MVKVEELILAYLQSNRRLVVPGFGAFMAKEGGERVFSELLRNDDGVLASLLKDNGLSDMEAAIVIDRFIFEVRHELEQYGYCRLGALGTLRIEPETKALRLFPQVQGEVQPVAHTPYIPEPITEEDEPESNVVDVVADTEVLQAELPLDGKSHDESVADVQVKSERVAEPKREQPSERRPQQPRPQPRPQRRPKLKKKARKKYDWVIVTLAVLVVIAALLAVAYGWYVSRLSESVLGTNSVSTVSQVAQPEQEIQPEQVAQPEQEKIEKDNGQ